jgi:hypothetical protein
MSLTHFLIAKLSRVDADFARRAMSTAQAQDEIDAPRSVEFSRGPGAMAYALALFIHRKPAHFYVGLTGLVVFALFMLTHFVTFLVQWGIELHGR